MSDLSWRQRLEQQPRLRDINAWPVIPISTIPLGRRQSYVRNQQIIARVLDHQPINEVAQFFHLTPGYISQLLKRCLGGDVGDEPALTEGLIPYRGIVDKQRISPVPTLAKVGKKHSGYSCAYKALLRDVPGLDEALDNAIRAKLEDRPEAQTLTPSAYHGLFKSVLETAHWPRDRYPYTTASYAYASTSRDLYKRTDEIRYEQSLPQTSTSSLVFPSKQLRALQNIQIDEHKIDFKGRVHLMFNDELIPLRLARATLLVARDVATNANLGYYIAPTRSPNQQDMLTLFEVCVTPWKPLDLKTPGFKYVPGARFPSGLPGGFPISFGFVDMDNAWIHDAKSVTDLLCVHFGSTIHEGKPALPVVRGLIEAIFNYINIHVSHRPASTTGSYPTDPIKESRMNKKQIPVITFETFNEAISILLTADNVKPRAKLGNATSLDLFKHHVKNHYVRYIPKIMQQQFQPFVGTKEVPVHRKPEQKNRPYVNFWYARYYDPPGKVSVIGLEKRVRIEFDRRDVRTIRVYTLNGVYLGELPAPKAWLRFPHSMATRQWLHKKAKEYGFRARDPLADYFRWLLKTKKNESAALSLLKVYTEFTRGQEDGKAIIVEQEASSSYEQNQGVLKKRTFAWSRDMAYSRK